MAAFSTPSIPLADLDLEIGTQSQQLSTQLGRSSSPAPSGPWQSSQLSNPNIVSAGTSRNCRAASVNGDTTTLLESTQPRVSIIQFLISTRYGNIIAIAGLVIAFLSLILAAYSGVILALATKWTARNDALQSCLTASTVGIYSEYCNKTMAAGVTKPPVEKRLGGLRQAGHAVIHDASGEHSPLEAATLVTATAVVLTIAAGIFTIIAFRPHMEPFRSVLSLVKMPPWRTPGHKFNRHRDH